MRHVSGTRTGLGVALLALLLVGCNDRQKPSEGDGTVARDHEGVRPEGVSSTDAPLTTTYYIPQATIGDMYEVEAAGIASERTRNPAVRAFAARMTEDHGKTMSELQSFVAANPVNRAPAQSLDPRRRAMIGNLKNASDAEFDEVYLGQQAAAHDEAFYLHSSFANNGDDRKLQELAGRTAELIQHHKRMLTELGSGGAQETQ